MESKVIVLDEKPNSFETRKGAKIETWQLSCMEQPGGRCTLVQGFDYECTPEEKATVAGKMVGQTIELGIREVSVFGGRLRVRGKIFPNGQNSKAK